jgi:hypothetical protein
MPDNHVPVVKVAQFITPTSFAIAFRAIASANGRPGVRLHEESLRAAERDIRMEGKSLAGRELQMR